MSSFEGNWPPPEWPPLQPQVVQAHFGWRILGRLLDSISSAIAAFGGILAIALTITWWAPEWLAVTTILSYWVMILFLQLHWEATGGSPLRKLVGLEIVDIDTLEHIGYARGFGRIVVSNISGLCLGLGHLWMLWDRRKQTWHDKAVRSTVIKRNI